MFKKVTAVVLLVKDLQPSLVFYRDIMGLEVAQVEAKFAAFKMDDQDFALIEYSEAADMVKVGEAAFHAQIGTMGKALLCTRVENVDVAYETLSAKGVEFTQPPVDQYWGLRTAFFKDPEGNLWEIAHPIGS